MTDPRLAAIAVRSVGRLHVDLEDLAPFLAVRLSDWTAEMFGDSALADRFLAPAAFPILALPWWVEESLSAPDEERQEQLVVSSIAGYLYIRLIDNVMDGDGPGDPRLLAGLAPLSVIFVRPYRAWFPAAHPFWAYFDRIWSGTADLTAQDAYLAEVGPDTFRHISARKTEAAKIPVAAICHALGHTQRLALWESFIEAFGRFHQLRNDLHSWRRDVETGSATLLLSEAARRGHPKETVADWLLREGLGWSVGSLRRAMAELLRLSPRLQSPGLEAYLARRAEALELDDAVMRRGLEEAARLGAVPDRVSALRSHPGG